MRLLVASFGTTCILTLDQFDKLNFKTEKLECVGQQNSFISYQDALFFVDRKHSKLQRLVFVRLKYDRRFDEQELIGYREDEVILLF